MPVFQTNMRSPSNPWTWRQPNVCIYLRRHIPCFFPFLFLFSRLSWPAVRVLGTRDANPKPCYCFQHVCLFRARVVTCMLGTSERINLIKRLSIVEHCYALCSFCLRVPKYRSLTLRLNSLLPAVMALACLLLLPALKHASATASMKSCHHIEW